MLVEVGWRYYISFRHILAHHPLEHHVASLVAARSGLPVTTTLPLGSLFHQTAHHDLSY
jgi:hypothetical protein